MEHTIKTVTETVIEMALCEIPNLYLHPGVLYRFIVIQGCQECERLAGIANSSRYGNGNAIWTARKES